MSFADHGKPLKQQTLVSRLAAAQPTRVATSTDQLPSPPVRQRQAQRRLTAEQAKQLVNEYEAGADMKELAARAGACIGRRWRHSCGRPASRSAGRAFRTRS
jgi:hypothetical protein